jgi:hypothetical protein
MGRWEEGGESVCESSSPCGGIARHTNVSIRHWRREELSKVVVHLQGQAARLVDLPSRRDGSALNFRGQEDLQLGREFNHQI